MDSVLKMILFLCIIITSTNANHLLLGGGPGYNHVARTKMLADFNVCVKSMAKYPFLPALHSQRRCLKHLIFSCLWTNNEAMVLARTVTRYHPYCGWVMLREIAVPDVIYNLRLEAGYAIIVIYRKFVTLWSNLCSQIGLQTRNHNREKNVYCGHRAPWLDFTHGDTKVLLLYTRVSGDIQTFNVEAFYELVAADHVVSTIAYQITPILTGRISTITRAINPLFNHLLSSYSVIVLTVATNPFAYFSVQVYARCSEEQYVSLVLYDGPGKASPSILSISRCSTVQQYDLTPMSHYLTLIINNNRKPVPFKLTFTTKLLNDLESLATKRWCPDKFLWKEESGQIEQNVMGSSRYGANTICSTKHSTGFGYEKHGMTSQHSQFFAALSIEKFNFIGPTAFDAGINNRCQYGGLYLYSRIKGEISQIKEYCENMNNVIQGTSASEVFIILKWLHGYSRGGFAGKVIQVTCKTEYLTCNGNKFVEMFLIETIQCIKYIHTDKIDSENDCKIKIVPKHSDIFQPLELTRSGNLEFQACNISINVSTTSMQAWPFSGVVSISTSLIYAEQSKIFMNALFITISFDQHQMTNCRQDVVVRKYSFCPNLISKGDRMNDMFTHSFVTGSALEQHFVNVLAKELKTYPILHRDDDHSVVMFRNTPTCRYFMSSFDKMARLMSIIVSLTANMSKRAVYISFSCPDFSCDHDVDLVEISRSSKLSYLYTWREVSTSIDWISHVNDSGGFVINIKRSREAPDIKPGVHVSATIRIITKPPDKSPLTRTVR